MRMNTKQWNSSWKWFVPVVTNNTGITWPAHERFELVFMTVGVIKLRTSWNTILDILNRTTVGVCSGSSFALEESYNVCKTDNYCKQCTKCQHTLATASKKTEHTFWKLMNIKAIREFYVCPGKRKTLCYWLFFAVQGVPGNHAKRNQEVSERQTVIVFLFHTPT